MESPARNLGPSSKALQVRSMFAEIAPRYDFLNHALSLNIDKRWRRLVIRQVARYLSRPGALALDLCCGTADLSIELGAIGATVGVDFCRPMLDLGKKKVQRSNLAVELIEGDALNLPVADSVFDVVTIAFGLRNIDGTLAGLSEIYRVLKEEGRCVVLEFSRPQLPVFRSLFNFYFTRVLPRIGNAVSGSSFAYQYLPESVQTFPDQKELAGLMESVGFSDVRYYNLFGGVASLHIGDK
ncbi:MAG TPA: bifunctional demethylmenaquinone methyltransferase/2-methoxy-6-polyprenyl-1,4-benzoquinol methylase UbiE [Blastocatellia bacterium]|nr:bifunctional demethylmenaquinone methyltransferase/2-methoxy-6-polyprenyl-1,4-benzoquinol methylase UbiE [Blastocatellia bacterium]